LRVTSWSRKNGEGKKCWCAGGRGLSEGEKERGVRTVSRSQTASGTEGEVKRRGIARFDPKSHLDA